MQIMYMQKEIIDILKNEIQGIIMVQMLKVIHYC